MNSDILEYFKALEQESEDFGFEWPDHNMIIEQVQSECAEVKQAIEHESDDRVEDEMGDLIHSTLSLCVFTGLDPYKVLKRNLSKYAARLEQVKVIAQEEGLSHLKDLSIDEKLRIWKKAKMRSNQ